MSTSDQFAAHRIFDDGLHCEHEGVQMLGFDVSPQHTWSALEILLGTNDRDQKHVLHDKNDT